MRIELPENVKRIISKIEEYGYEAYAVGGCVRDSILGRVPNDWDITTSAEPKVIKGMFKKTFDTGIKHGTVSVLIGKDIYEVTTFRIDGEYEDSRHPKEVTFTRNLKEDLLRRDFTINAMAYNDRVGLVDLYGGLSDIESRIIRCVGNPDDRFSEDALRIMRAVRFAAQLDYNIEETTRGAIIRLAPTLSNISAERVQTELIKLLTSDHPGHIRMAYELGITRIFLPEFDDAMNCEQNNPNHEYSVGEHTIKAIENTPNDKVLRLAALFHDLGKVSVKTTDEEGVDHFYGHPEAGVEIARRTFRRLKFDNDTVGKVCRIIENHDWTIGASLKHMRRYINRIGEEAFPLIFDFNKADLLAQSEYRRSEKFELLDSLKEEYERIVRENECVSLKTLAVTGKDIVSLGIPAGPKVGRILAELLDTVIDDPSKNDKNYLLSLVKEME